MKFNDFAQGCWLVCNDLQFAMRFGSNNVWTMGADCQHGHYNTTVKALDPELGLAKLYQIVTNHHKEKT